jgi:hypothetical protein
MASGQTLTWPEQYGSFRNGILCLNYQLHDVSANHRWFSFRSWMLTWICLIGGSLINLWFHHLVFSLFISSICALTYGELKKCQRHSVDKIIKLPPTEDESVMAPINVANCQIHIRKVKINEDDSPSFRITITHKTLRWHVWRSSLFPSSPPHLSAQ